MNNFEKKENNNSGVHTKEIIAFDAFQEAKQLVSLFYLKK